MHTCPACGKRWGGYYSFGPWCSAYCWAKDDNTRYARTPGSPDYRKGLVRGLDTGRVILQASGRRPVAGFTLPLPGPVAQRREWMRGFASGLLIAEDEETQRGQPDLDHRGDGDRAGGGGGAGDAAADAGPAAQADPH